MIIILQGVPSVFAALWVAKNEGRAAGGNLKDWLQIKQKIGITNKEISSEIYNQYQLFQQLYQNEEFYTRLELFFEQ